MPPKVIVFTGAPESSALNWDPAGLLTSFQPAILSFINASNPPPTPSSTASTTAWRSLSVKPSHLPTGLSQLHAYPVPAPRPAEETGFFTTASISFESMDALDIQGSSQAALLSQFYDYSLAVHEEIQSSQLPPNSDQNGSSFDSFATTATEDSFIEADVSTESVSPPLESGRAGVCHLSDLEDIPTATQLLALQPQTVTVNLIVGVISIAPPRTVKTRWGSNMSLVEVLVGDDTKSGFAITFWLPSDPATEGTLAQLRRQDIVLLQNVALNVFMKKVYGQSLRKGLTKVQVLYRRKLDEEDVGGHYRASDLASKKAGHPQLEKTRKVREWVLRFVGGNEGGDGDGKGKATKLKGWDRPPDDTQ